MLDVRMCGSRMRDVRKGREVEGDMKTIRAKFRCEEAVERTDVAGDVEGYDITLRPVVGGSEENDTFFKYTPWGELRIGIVAKETAEALEVGKEYYLDLTPAE